MMGGLPGEAGQQYVRWFTDWPSTHVNAGQTVEVVSLADPVSALRVLLADERARAALREMLTNDGSIAAGARALDDYARATLKDRAVFPPSNVYKPHARLVLDAAVDALASGVEGERNG